MLKAARINRRLTQQEVAQEIGVSRGTIANWETVHSYPSVSFILTIECIYGFDYDDIRFCIDDNCNKRSLI